MPLATSVPRPPAPARSRCTPAPATTTLTPPPPAPPVPGLLDVAPLLLALGCTLEPGQRLVLLALASHGGPRSKGLYPSVQRLAGETGLSERTVQKHLHELEQLGVVRIHQRPGASNLYELVLDRMHVPRTNLPEPGASSPTTAPTRLQLTLEEMRTAMAFVAEAGADTALVLAPELLHAEAVLPTAATAAASSPPPPATRSPSDEAPVQWLHPSSSAHRAPPPSTAQSGAQPSPPGVQPPREGGAAAAPELLSENLSRELETRGEKARARDPRERVCDSPDDAPGPAEVSALWSEAWSGRYSAAYTAERSDGPRLAFLARTAHGKAQGRCGVLLARGEPSPGLGELARQYLGHLFRAYLADPGQPTREGPGFLRWKKHPLRYLEGDLLRLGDPWTQLDRQRALLPPAPRDVTVPRAAPARSPHVLILPRTAPVPSEVMPTLGALLGRQPVPVAVAVQPPRSIEEIRAMHGPNVSEAELACLVRAEQRRWAYQQQKAQEQCETELRRGTG